MLAIFKREFKAFFTTPVAYIILTAFYLFSGWRFTLYYGAGYPAVENIIMELSIIIVLSTGSRELIAL